MNPRLPDGVVEFGESAEKALLAAGGVDLARAAEADPGERPRAAAALESIGAPELDPYGDLDSAAAAGELCRAAGRVALPYPVPAVLAGSEGIPLALSAARPGSGLAHLLRVDHGDLFPEWRTLEIDAEPRRRAAAAAAPTGPRLATRLGPFVTPLALADNPNADEGSGGAHDRSPADLHLILTGWLVLGTLERALELTVDHVRGRVQFGQALSSFQAVQFQLADVAVAVDGLRELCRFGLWRWWEAPAYCRPDSLAVRVGALDAARAVLRTCQQLHGAAGVCDEYDVSVLSRHVQPALRLPFGAERTAELLGDAIEKQGFDGLFRHGGRAAQ